jgi:hypothetical protein
MSEAAFFASEQPGGVVLPRWSLGVLAAVLLGVLSFVSAALIVGAIGGWWK